MACAGCQRRREKLKKMLAQAGERFNAKRTADKKADDKPKPR